MTEPMVKLPKDVAQRYNIINSVYSLIKNYSQTATALQISINTVKTAVKWFEDGRPDLAIIGRSVKITRIYHQLTRNHIVRSCHTYSATFGSRIKQRKGL